MFLNSGDTLSNNDILEKITSQFNNEDIIYGNINFDGKIKKINYKKKYSLCDEKTYISAEFIKRSFLYIKTHPFINILYDKNKIFQHLFCTN